MTNRISNPVFALPLLMSLFGFAALTVPSAPHTSVSFQDSPFQSITKKIDQLEKNNWNQPTFKSIENDIRAKANTGLLTDGEKKQLTKNLDLAYILTLRRAVSQFFTNGKQANGLTSLMKSEARRYKDGAYRDNVADINKAIDNFERLQREEKTILNTAPSSFTEPKIESHFKTLENLETQPFLKGSVLVRQMSQSSKDKIREILFRLKSETAGTAISQYVTTAAYHADSTRSYQQLLEGIRNHHRIASLTEAKPFCEEQQRELEAHRDVHERFPNTMKFGDSKSCTDLFGKYNHYVKECETIHQDTLGRN